MNYLLTNREGKEGGGKGPLISEELSLTLSRANNQVLFQDMTASKIEMNDTPKIDYGIEPIRFGSVCSGIEAFSEGTKDLPYEAVWLSEIEKFPCTVLAHHYPEVPNLGDMTKIFDNETFKNETIELLVGGTPCQSFSIAGLRGGLDDDRGNLALVFARILLQKQPRWFIWENVPGVFSSYSGDETESSDFAAILNGFRECGYSVSYRVFDSQYFGVPQRRRRVFVVGHLGSDWRPSAAVLFERESLRRNITPRREPRKEATGALRAGSEVSGTLSRSGAGVSRTSGQGNGFDFLVTEEINETITDNGQRQWPATIANTLDTKLGTKMGLDNQHIDSGASMFVPFNTTTGSHGDDATGALQARDRKGVGSQYVEEGKLILQDPKGIYCIQTGQTGANGSNISEDISFTLDRASVPAGCLQGSMIGREDKNGLQGDGMNVEQSFTLNKTDKHAKVYDTTQITSPQNGSNPKEEICHTLSKGADPPLLVKAFQQNGDGELREGDVIGTLNKNSNPSGRNVPMIHTHIARRLTPTECLRLQGFPDDYLDIPGASDSAKYAAIGNSMTTYVMKWIAHRIALFEKISKDLK